MAPMNFDTRSVDAVLPYHFSAGPVGIGDVHPYDSKYQNIAVSTVPGSATPLLIGMGVQDPRSGQEYRYIKTTVAVTPGQLLAPAAAVAITNSVPSGAANNGTNGKIDQSGVTWTAAAYAGDFLLVNTGTGSGQGARILWNTAATAATGTLYLDRQLATALDTTSDIVIYRPYSVKLTAAAAGDICVGVSCGTLTGDGYYGWMQTAGFCPFLISEAAIAAQAGIHASATAGKAVGSAGAAGDAEIGWALAAASGADEFFAAMLYRLS